MKRLLSLFGTVLAIFAIAWWVGLDKIVAGYADLDWRWTAAVLALMAVNLVVVIFRLHRVLAHFGCAVPWAVTVRASVSGFVSSLFVFNLFGSILGRQLVLRRHDVPAPALVVASGYERFVMALVGLAAAAGGFVAVFGSHTVVEALARTPLVQAAIVVPLAVALSLAMAGGRHEAVLLRTLLSGPALARFAAVAGISAGANLLVFGAYVAALDAVGVSLPFWQAMGAAAIVTFAASLPISVNGWGVRELAAIYAFGALGVSSHDAVAASVLVGLCATVVVLAAAPLLARREPAATAIVRTVETDAGLPDFDRLAGLLLAHLAAFFLFFQIQASVAGGWISLNLADPLAVLALCLVLVQFAFTRRAPVALAKPFALWLAALSVLFVFAFARGYILFGFSSWAFGNRLVGWLVLLGYSACGALIVASFGGQGRRRLAVSLIATAVVVIVVYSIERTMLSFGVINYFMAANFQGYSGNRNTLSFQLLVCISLALAYTGVQLRAKAGACRAVLMGVLVLGVWQAGSIAGLAATTALLAFALWRWPERRSFVLSAIAVALVLAFVWWAIPNWLSPPVARLLSENSAVFDPSEILAGSSTAERWSSIVGGLSMWRENPLFGGGLGAVVRLNLGATGAPLVTHSTPVWVLAEFGLVGAIAFASLPAWLLWRYRMRLASLALPQHVAIQLLLLFFAVFSMVHDVAFQRIWWLALGALAAGVLKTSSRPAP
ncbi:MAG: flippase-like domain-containing protein [Telmatospirillum sp.]|nr:flippase-like domain-containing protein [Telmatospirillum sp.]